MAPAEATCLGLLSESPHLVDAEFALGVICFRKGDHSAALPHLERFLGHRPEDLAALAVTAQVLFESGQFDPALALARRAHELRPDEGPLLLLHLTGKIELAGSRPVSALKAFRDLVRLNPAKPTGYLGAADAFLALGSSFDAVGLLAKAAEIAPNRSVLMRLGCLELKLGRPARALAAAERVLAHTTLDLEANTLAGQSLIELDRVEDAEAFWQRASVVTPASHRLELNRGTSLMMMGRFKEGDRHLRESIDREPRQGSAYQVMFANRTATAADESLLRQMEQVHRTEDLDPTERAALSFALGKAWGDLEDPGKAFEYFDKGHGIQREMLSTPFDLDQMKEQFRIQQALFLAPIEPKEPSALPPIFVTGMMRSGTTLAEQILASHSQVVGAGEIDFWTGSEALIVDRSGPGLIPDVARERASTYRRILDSFGEGARVVDKHPGNLNVVGMIHRILPDAQFICLRRRPIDIAVSIWGMYSDPYAPLTVSRRGIVDAIKQSIVQAEYWRDVLPSDRLLEVFYEDLVSDPKNWISRMLEFCGLPWEGACLNASAQTRTVKTPNMWQVRQPIYRTSVGRWERFKGCLGEFEELLGR